MPEGDTVHLTAERLHAALAGERLLRSDLRVPALATADLAGQTVREVIARGKHTIPPRGSTVIEPGDRLYVLIPQGTRGAIDDVFSRWRRRV